MAVDRRWVVVVVFRGLTIGGDIEITWAVGGGCGPWQLGLGVAHHRLLVRALLRELAIDDSRAGSVAGVVQHIRYSWSGERRGSAAAGHGCQELAAGWARQASVRDLVRARSADDRLHRHPSPRVRSDPPRGSKVAQVDR